MNLSLFQLRNIQTTSRKQNESVRFRILSNKHLKKGSLLLFCGGKIVLNSIEKTKF